jgi:hypothetical protein
MPMNVLLVMQSTKWMTAKDNPKPNCPFKTDKVSRVSDSIGYPTATPKYQLHFMLSFGVQNHFSVSDIQLARKRMHPLTSHQRAHSEGLQVPSTPAARQKKWVSKDLPNCYSIDPGLCTVFSSTTDDIPSYPKT